MSGGQLLHLAPTLSAPKGGEGDGIGGGGGKFECDTAISGAAVVSDDAQHRGAVHGEAGEGALRQKAGVARHLGGGGIARPGQQRGDGRPKGAPSTLS